MDGFHALGTQGRSHPRKRQDPAEAKMAKKKLLRCRLLNRPQRQFGGSDPPDRSAVPSQSSRVLGSATKVKQSTTHTRTHIAAVNVSSH